jgi:small membrane protein
MTAQLIFSVLLSVVLLYAWTAYRQSPLVGILVFLAALAGLYFVWIPLHAMLIAEWVGIGRGVDLIIYTWVVISLIIFLNLHLKVRSQTELITRLTRAIAISEGPNRR